MSNQKQKQLKPGSGKPADEDTSDQNQDLHSQGTRQYEGGRNPNMQSQRGNRQGDGRPTQQRKDDR
jgi:hypothetical protein